MNAREYKTTRLALGGMDTRLRPSEGTALIVDNLRYNPGDGTWESLEGTVSIGSIGSAGVGCRWFNPRPNQRMFVVERRTAADQNTLTWLDLQGGGTTTIATRRRVENDDGNAESFIELGRWLYFASAHNAWLRWDGVNVYPVGHDRAPPPPEVYGPEQGVNLYDVASGVYESLAGGRSLNVQAQRGVGEQVYSSADGDARWRYGYAYSVVNDLGQESPLSPVVFASGTNTSDEGKHMVRLRIPKFPKHIRGIRLWRTINVEGVDVQTGLPMYLHSTFAAAHGFDFIDHAPDLELTEEWDPDAVGAVPAGVRTVTVWQGAVWVAGMDDDPNGLRYSHANFPEQFPTVNRLSVGSHRTGRVLALYPVPRGLVVLKTSGVYLVKGNPLDGYRAEVVDESAGLAARRAVAYVPDLGLVWLSASGPKLLTGALDDEQPTRVQGLGDTIADYWRRNVRGDRIEASVCVYDPMHHEVWFHVPHRGDNRPSLGLVFHTTLGGWSVRTDWQISGFDYHRGEVYAVGWNATSAYKFTRGSRTPNLSAGSTIESTYATNALLADPPVSVDKVLVFGRALGSGNTWTLDTRTDRAQTWTTQTETERAALTLMRDAPEWGTATWSASAYWDDEHPTFTPVSVRTRTARMLELRLRSTDRLVLADLELSYQGDGGPPPQERR